MSRTNHKGVEDARKELPTLLAEAERGRSTVITRRGRSIAAIVPLEQAARTPRQLSLLALAGTGKGLWGRSGQRSLKRLRDQWDR